MENRKKTTKLTTEILEELGFVGQGKSVTGQPLYRLEYEKNCYQIQMELNNYAGNNPNNGILSIYYPELKDTHVIAWDDIKNKGKSKKVDYIEEEDGKNIIGIKYVTFPEIQHPIAWNVTTLERLNDIYTSLTMNQPLKLKK